MTICISPLQRGHTSTATLKTVRSRSAFRRDGCFVAIPAHDAVVLAEAWRRAVLALFVRQGWLEEDAATSMLAWPHSGFRAVLST